MQDDFRLNKKYKCNTHTHTHTHAWILCREGNHQRLLLAGYFLHGFCLTVFLVCAIMYSHKSMQVDTHMYVCITKGLASICLDGTDAPKGVRSKLFAGVT